MDMNRKRIVVTGAASGIGYELLKQLSHYDARIVAADVNLIDRTPIRGSTAQIYPFQGDLSQQSGVDDLFDYALETMGGIELFIANAGFAYYEAINQADWAHLERIFQLNVISPLYAAARMKEINPHTDYNVVMTASAMAKLALPGYAVYAGTKAALDRFAEAYRYEMPPNAHLMLVYPIATRTNFFDTANDGTPVPFPSQTSAHVAERIIKGIERNAQSVNPSIGFSFFWTLNRIFPLAGRLYQMVENRRFNRWKINHQPTSQRTPVS